MPGTFIQNFGGDYVRWEVKVAQARKMEEKLKQFPWATVTTHVCGLELTLEKDGLWHCEELGLTSKEYLHLETAVRSILFNANLNRRVRAWTQATGKASPLDTAWMARE